MKEENNNEKPTLSRRDALKRIATFGAGAFGVVAASSCDLFYDNYYDYYNYYSDYYYNYSVYYSNYYYYSDYYNYYSNYYW